MRLLLRLLIVLLLVALPAPVYAFEPRAGSTVFVGEPVQDDLYAAGSTVQVTASVDGDIVAAGGSIILTGAATGGVLAAGGTVRIGGTVGRTIRAAAGTLTIDSRVTHDAVIAGGTVLVGPQALVGRDVVAAGGNVEVAGNIGRNAWLSGGNVVISGTVQGNVDVQADRLVVLPSARIAGVLRHSADTRTDIQPGAQVTGGVQQTPMAQRFRRPPMAFGFAGRVVELLWLLVVGFVLLALVPGAAVWRVSARVGSQFWQNLLAGFVLMIVVPAAAVLMLVTIVGIPLALLVIALYFVTLYLGQVAVAGWVGARLFSSMQRSGGGSPYLAFAVGAIVLVVLFAIPFLGWVVRLIAVLLGFGALWAVAWGLRSRRAVASATGSV